MQHHHKEEERPPSFIPLSTGQPIELSPQTEVLIARFLAQDETDLQSVTRARIEELIAAYRELEATPEEAARSAIQQIQNERLDAQKRQSVALQSRTLSSSHSARPATLLALRWFGGAALATTALCTLIGATTNLFLYLTLMFTMFALPAVVGVAVGLRAQKRQAMGSFYALALLFPLKMLLDFLTMHRAGYGWDGLLWMAVDFALFWIPLGCLAAGLTGGGRNLLRRRRRLVAGLRNGNKPQILSG